MRTFDNMNIQSTQLGHPLRVAGDLQTKQQTKAGCGPATKEYGHCRASDVKSALGEGRMFFPRHCPYLFKDTVPSHEDQTNLETIDLSSDYIEKMKTRSFEHIHLFAIPRIGVSQLVDAHPGLFGDISGLPEGCRGIPENNETRSWRWYLASRVLKNSSSGGDLNLARLIYLNALYYQEAKRFYFPGRVICDTGFGGKIAVYFRDNAEITIPACNGLIQGSHVYGVGIGPKR